MLQAEHRKNFQNFRSHCLLEYTTVEESYKKHLIQCWRLKVFLEGVFFLLKHSALLVILPSSSLEPSS